MPFTNSSRVLELCLRPRAVACSARAKSAISKLAAAHRDAMAEAARASVKARSNCHSYPDSVAPAKAVLAHIRSAASAPKEPTNRPDQASQAAINRLSRLSSARDRAAMAQFNWLFSECSTARRNSSSLLANDKYSPWRETPAARATSSMDVLRYPNRAKTPTAASRSAEIRWVGTAGEEGGVMFTKSV